MKRALLILITLLSPQWLLAQTAIPDYYTRHGFLMAPPLAFDHGLLGFVNPAVMAFMERPELRFHWATEGSEAVSFQNWGLFSTFRYLGFSLQREKILGVGVTDFRLATAFGTSAGAVGLSYGWSTGERNALDREKVLTLGAVVRPARYFSLGFIGNQSLESSAREGVVELGLRPFGTPQLTLFADAALQKGTDLADAPWSAGAVVGVLPGVHVVGRYFRSEAFTVGLWFNLGRSGVAAQSRFLPSAEHEGYTYGVRLGGRQPSIVPSTLRREKHFLPLELQGRVAHLKYRLFDEDTLPLLKILRDIEAAIEDPRVGAVAVNLSSLAVLPEHAWEIRDALQRARDAGKLVAAFVDQVEMTVYHLVSVADRVILDPQGFLMLPGYALSRTYFKGALEKLGLGFDEWRFFKYKSAYESFSRESMSEADREQRQAYVDDLYEQVREEVCEARALTPAQFDSLVDERTFFQAEQALDHGLVDTLARWSAVEEVLGELAGRYLNALPAEDLLDNAVPLQNWGTPDRIAVVYGLGVCALDEGIRARWLEGVFQRLAADPAVKAVVFRVDSPGGDGMASDMVAEALRACSEEKPVVVSQGQVAASGGYWISMYADSILAGPGTVTGSIGVIGGWIYDQGFTEKLGLRADLVQRGAHADLGEGVTLPLLNLTVPARNLTPEERARAEETIREFYQVFVAKVAEGRNMTVEEVEALAQGRIYSGRDGQAQGLVDRLGSLLDAIDLARDLAGLHPAAEVEIVEIPEYEGLLNLGERLAPMPIQGTARPLWETIKLFAEKPGRPLPLLLPGNYPAHE